MKVFLNENLSGGQQTIRRKLHVNKYTTLNKSLFRSEGIAVRISSVRLVHVNNVLVNLSRYLNMYTPIC